MRRMLSRFAESKMDPPEQAVVRRQNSCKTAALVKYPG
jgi:hypothetical protein